MSERTYSGRIRYIRWNWTHESGLALGNVSVNTGRRSRMRRLPLGIGFRSDYGLGHSIGTTQVDLFICLIAFRAAHVFSI